MHIVLEPWRANISLYKNVMVAHIFLHKNTCSNLSLTVANDQITSVCTQLRYMEVKLIRLEEIVLSLHQSFLLPIIAIAKALRFPLG